MKRRTTRQIFVGTVPMGGSSPVSVQSMTNTFTADIKKTVHQINQLEIAGCDIVRVAVPDKKSARAISHISERINIPLVADIHFDYTLAIKSIENGADKIRINPGNIGSINRVKCVLKAAKEKNVPVRIGVNSGSLEKSIIEKFNGVSAEGLAESAVKYVNIFKDAGFEDLVVSIKASDVLMMIKANRIFSEKSDCPLHLGVTEAGIPSTGIIRSSVGIGVLLAQGIGDTIRVSLTGDPLEEVRVGLEILKSFNMRRRGINIISCPTCGRTQVDLISIVEKLQKKLSDVDKSITVAVMGCAVNGPGEAKEADLGVACGKGNALLFKKGEVIKKIKEKQIITALIKEIKCM